MRLQRWALRLMRYNFDIEYRRGQLHANADTLSRLPLEESVHFLEIQGENGEDTELDVS